MTTFANKLALITGGSSGIGLALAKALAARGASVFILARRPELLQAASQEILSLCKNQAQQVGIITADVSNREDIEQTLGNFLDRHNAPDYLINSAGVAHPGLFEELDNEIFEWMMRVNYFGTVYVTKAILPAMTQRGSGHIVNISSIAGFLGTFGYTAYGASKFAVRGFSDALRAELKLKGVRVSVVFPPDTKTPQLEYEKYYKPAITAELSASAPPMTPEAVAEAVLRGVARNRSIITPGFESALFFHLNNLLGSLIYPLMDLLVADARRKVGAAKNRSRRQDQTQPYDHRDKQVDELHPDRSQQDHI